MEMKNHISITSIYLILIFQHSPSVQSTSFCALFSNKSAPGVSGYFGININEINGTSYEYFLDLTSFQASCDLDKGLSFHIHSYWTNDSVDSSTNQYCGKSYTGGHLDPNLACSPSSEEAEQLCPLLGRVSEQSYTYRCNPHNFASGNYGECEVGDLSGKMGYAYPVRSNSRTIFQSNHSSRDYLPPYANSYNKQMGVLKPWTSIVFHCSTDNTRLACAKFQAWNSSSCAVSYATSEDGQSDLPWRFLGWDVYSKLIVSCIVITVAFILGMTAFFIYTRPKGDYALDGEAQARQFFIPS